MPFKKLPPNFKAESKADVAVLHDALAKLNIKVSKTVRTDVNAVKEFQKVSSLPDSGALDVKTVTALNDSLHDTFISANKYRAQKLHGLLASVGVKVDTGDTRSVTATTRAGIEALQRKFNMNADGKITEEFLTRLNNEAVNKKLESKTQSRLLQAALKKVNTIAKLNLEIAPDELNKSVLGPTTANLIKAVQEKYKLPPTGAIDKATLDKINSVAASKGTFVKKLNKPAAKELTVVDKALRLNKVSPAVNHAQKALSFLGYKISESEFKTQTFGATTRKAVVEFQKVKGLKETGHLEQKELKLLNQLIADSNPNSGLEVHKPRVRGSVRNELWERQPNRVIKIYEKLLDGKSAQPLATKKNFLNGFFDITYNPPLTSSGQVKEKYHLVIELYDVVDNDTSKDVLIKTKVHYNVSRIQWANFTEGNTPYGGDTEFETIGYILQGAIGNSKIEDLHETAAERQITQLAVQTGLDTDDIMRFVLSSKIASQINKQNILSTELFYAFVRQNVPATLPPDLLRGASEWETFAQLVENASTGIIFADESIQKQVIENALALNLVRRLVKVNLDAILAELKTLRIRFTLEKPMLVGNENLKTLLQNTSIQPQHYDLVAQTFVAEKGINPRFWKTLSDSSAVVGANAITDLSTVVELGNITKNHLPTLLFLKGKIGTDTRFTSSRSFAKISKAEITTLINENGNSVPANIPGNSAEEKVEAYGASIKKRMDILFPALSLIGEVKRSNTPKLTKFTEVEQFVDNHPDLNFITQNIDKYVLTNNLTINSKTLEEIKVVQRVHKLTLDSQAGATLIDAGLHSSTQIYFKGKKYLADLLESKGIAKPEVTRLYEFAGTQYFKILTRFLEFVPQANTGTPAAITPPTFSTEEIKAALGDIPNLESLFGSLDYCDCQHCKSLYGPAAYLTDMLRFINEHDSLVSQGGQTLKVKEILFERRPDIGNIKLNCENTNTPMPYIDLVCEILENNIAPSQKNFSYQTTLSAKELRAVPQYIRTDAYRTLAVSNFPMSYSLNLFQEETRAYLKFLGAPWFDLMEVFQKTADPAAKVPDDGIIAGEFFDMSSFERNLIITANQNTADQTTFWNLDPTLATVAVVDLMNRSRLTYYELRELLFVRFVNAPGPAKSIIDPTGSCDTKEQKVTNLTIAKFDLMHRFIRLWRKTKWMMWELDLLIRNPKIGNQLIDSNTLINLKLFKQLQEKLNLPVEILLTFYGEINREVRTKPDKPDVKVYPLYKNIFQNIAVTNPVDPYFVGIDGNDNLVALDAAISFDTNNPGPPYNGYTPVPIILSALAIPQEDFELLEPKTNRQLSVDSLSILLRHAYLARGLRLTVKDLFLMLAITNTADPFATLKATADLLKNFEVMKASGFSLEELDYVLNYSPESSAGLRDEIIVQSAEALRKMLLSNKESIEKLKISEPDRATILSFNTGSLTPLADAALLAALLPLQNIMSPAQLKIFTEAGFPAENASYIAQFGAQSLAAAVRVVNIGKLTEAIKKLHQDLSNLVNRNKNQIRSHVASSFNITDEQAKVLLSNLTLAGPKTLLAELEDEKLIDKNPDDTFKWEITAANFPNIFKAHVLLQKSSLIVARLKLTEKDLQWFTLNHVPVSTLDFSALPLAAAGPPNDFNGWRNLFKFLDFKSKFPEPEGASIRTILATAKDATKTKDQIFQEICKLTQWNKAELTELDTRLQLYHPVNSVPAPQLDYTNAEVYRRLNACFERMKLTGVKASTIFKWVNKNDVINDDVLVATQSRQAVKSKYEQDTWLQKIGPIYDDLREKKRKGLVEFHLELSQRNETEKVTFNGEEMPNPLYWKDSNVMYKYFLIDVEMTAIQLTSRIKQAISSVQLFVQRCFLNLENRYVRVTVGDKADATSANSWAQWKWMKNYRIWEANRKVFFYPENWIEPELRDDKSPFFEELENEIMQGEMTKENVEAAFVNYLHKVDEVSHLEVCGMYHQMENLAGTDSLYEINIVHVIGRTKTIPHIYYYRTYDMNYNLWSAWSKVDADITGDHVTPVVYNRKLHLFWLQFVEKPIKNKKVPAAQPTNGPSDSPEPQKLLEVQLGWSIKKAEGWSSKKISKQKLIHPWERPQFSYNLKPYYQDLTNELYLDIYLTTSQEFNDTLFYDHRRNSVKGFFATMPGMINQPNPWYRTKTRFNQALSPWHSSSFVFNGEIRDVQLKALPGQYYLGDADTSSYLDSYKYVHESFGDSGRAINVMNKFEGGPRLSLPTGMHFNNTRLANNLVHAPNLSSLRVLESSSTATLLNAARSPFELVITQQDLQMDLMEEDHPMFYQDSQRAFFIKPELESIINNYGQVILRRMEYRFRPFYHPYTMLFLRELNRSGIDGLLTRDIQNTPYNYPPYNTFTFSSYQPAAPVIVDDTVKRDIVDFSFGGAYSIYNWELFFHAPLLIACRLMQNQKFEDAMNWFHYIFNPTNIEDLPTPKRYWITKPFFEYNSAEYRKQRIESILSNLQLQENKDQLNAWRNNPFKPHLIARYRPVAYQKNVVMKYIDNLIAWGDMLFRRDTIESINEASLLYMLAYEILGDRPKKVANVKQEDKTYNELEPLLDDFGNARMDVIIEDTLVPTTVVPGPPATEPVPRFETFYFCIPNNDYLTKYWDTVEDRLFKIRHSMNIEGIVRQLPLFEPPIDPALLVKAAAAGIDLNSVLSDLSAPVPYYRFRIVLQKAVEFANEVKQLGDKLLSVLEKKDAEQLSLMRSQHEIQLLEAVKEIKKKQIAESLETMGSLNKTLEMADAKKDYYESREFMNTEETASAVLNIVSSGVQLVGGVLDIISGAISAVPDFYVGAAGFGGSPVAVAHITGGSKIASILQGVARGANTASQILDRTSGLVATIGGYQRRKDEWAFQTKLAITEQAMIQFQINAADIRKSIAEKDLDNHELQIENTRTVDDYMRNKYTNQQLFSWMVTQISTAYFQAYQLAFDMAKKAEKCFQYELGVQSSNYIQFGYWDSLKKGLMSGDKLTTDLRKLEAAYINENKREFEITKHISLGEMFPLNLITLKETGKCTISLPEWLFDMDYPGHYMRRIKNVSISIPCIVGPFTGVNCTLSLLRNEIRVDPTGAYPKVDENDTRFRTMFGSISSIVTSSAQNDSGMFDLNFNDDRYLPFEGTGAISDWQIDMPKETNYFNFNSLSDVILHISYTARNGGSLLATGAMTNLQTALPNSTARLFSLKHEFGTEWHKFINPENGNDQELVINLRPEHFQFFVRGKLKNLKIKTIELFLDSSVTDPFVANVEIHGAKIKNNALDDWDLSPEASYGNAHHAQTRSLSLGTLNNLDTIPVKIKLRRKTTADFKSLTPDLVVDSFLFVQLGI